MNGGEPVSTRSAATVVVARDHAARLQVLLAKRSAGLRFMGGVHVFPGGALHMSDAGLAALTRSQPRSWSEPTQASLDSTLACTAVRETLEEVGLLLSAEPAPAPAVLAQLRSALTTGQALAPLLKRAGVSLDLGALLPLVRWITPQSEPIRFDTRFYVTRAPQCQAATPDGRETVEICWCTPAEALAGAERGDIRLAVPTRVMLRELSDVNTVDELLAGAAAQVPALIEPMIRDAPDGQRYVVLPGDPEHPLPTPALRGPTRAPL